MLRVREQQCRADPAASQAITQLATVYQPSGTNRIYDSSSDHFAVDHVESSIAIDRDGPPYVQ